MIRNITYNNPEVKAEIDRLVGPAFGMWTRFKMKGIGSKRMLIHEASPSIDHWLNMQNTARYCYIELRPNGIIVHFRSILETFGWVVPYHHLSIFRNGNTFHLHGAGEVMKIGGINAFEPDFNFFKKLLDLQTDWRKSMDVFR
jgi:hypothetical protein